MPIVNAAARRIPPTASGVVALVGVGVLLTSDAMPQRFTAETRDFLAALPLVLIAVTHVVYRAVWRGPPVEWAKTTMLAFAFLFWAANLFSSDGRLARLFNDIAIAGFVLDAFVNIIGFPPGSDRERA